MKRLTAILVASFAFTGLSAQTGVEDVMKLLKEGRTVTLEYCVTVGTDVPVTYSGTACLQQGAFLLKGNGVEIYCDGKDLVCVDPKAREIYVEKACSIQEYVSGNIGNVKDFGFTNLSSRSEPEGLDLFRYDFSGKDSSWIVTDLR